MKKQLLFVLISLAFVCTGAFASGAQEKKPAAADTMMKSDDTMMKSDAAMAKDGIFKKDGKIMETMNGQTTGLMKDVMLKDGTTIMMDGTIVMKNGTKAMLKDGEMYDFDGMKSMVDTGMAK